MGNFGECLQHIRDLFHFHTQLKDERGKNEDVYIYFIKIRSGDKKTFHYLPGQVLPGHCEHMMQWKSTGAIWSRIEW